MAENKQWEYDYASLYNKNNAPGDNAGTGYVNVGSSGTNAANQHTDNAQDTTWQPASGMGGGSVPPPPAGGPAYQAAPQPDGAKHSAKKPKRPWGVWAGRVLTVLLAGVVGFAGGMAGARLSGTGSRVVMQQVQRPESENITTSTGGKDLPMSQVAGMVSPSVVVITTEKMVASGGWYVQNRVISGAGSGVIMSEDGYIMTNAHVVGGASYITVTIDDKDYDATLIGEDVESDIAVVKIDAHGLTPAVMGDSDTLAVGEMVLAVGNPLGELGGTVTDGIISALNRNVMVEGNEMTLIQASASVSPGNSGGGLFNMQGELIGIVNAKSSGDNAEGLGFAIPINKASQVASDLIENGYVSGRPAMGVTIVDVNSPEMAMQYGVSNLGVYIYGVEEGSPAEKAGLQPGDRLMSIGNMEVTEMNDLTNYIRGCKVGDTVQVVVARKGKILQAEMVLGERNAPASAHMPEPKEDAPAEEQPEPEADSQADGYGRGRSRRR